MGNLEGELTVTRGTYVHTGPTYPNTLRDPSEFEPDPEFGIEAVIDHTHARGFFPWQSRWWREGEFLIPLRPDLDEPTWGLVMVELFAHLADDEDVRPADVLRRALEKGPWHLYPGFRFVGSGGTNIVPGCCACLCQWPQLKAAGAPGTPWLGHDPDVTVTAGGERVLIRSAMPLLGTDELAFEPLYLATRRERYFSAVEELQQSLESVAARIERWAGTLTGEVLLAASLRERFREDFHVDGRVPASNPHEGHRGL